MSDIAVELASRVVELVVFFGGLLWAMRKFQSERLVIEAEANSDNATATKTMAEAGEEWMDSYNKLFRLFQERDLEFLELNRRVGVLENDKMQLQAELEEERRLRIQAETDRDLLQREVHDLRDALSTLRSEVEGLKSR